MPSGITHMLLIKELQDYLPDDSELKYILADNSDYLSIGAVAPDLPYASLADNDFFLSTQGPLADHFHYDLTNQIPLRSLDQLKLLNSSIREQVHRQMFSFFLGYISHLVADGIFHPFIRDKVGDYDNHKSAHRCLEMQLDVLYFEYITKKSGYAAELNYTGIQDELKNYLSSPNHDSTIRLFAQLIKEVYKENYTVREINGWIKGLNRLFELAAGTYLQIYRNLEANTFMFRNRSEINEQLATVLIKPEDDLPHNFLHRYKIDYFQDCVPRFFEQYVPLAQRAFEYVYEQGQALTEIEIPAINLDTGRLIEHPSLELIPEFWKGV